MSNPVEECIEAIFHSLENDNHEIDDRIESLKKALDEQGTNVATFDPTRLAQGNREGRKRMQSYFKKRGINVVFESRT